MCVFADGVDFSNEVMCWNAPVIEITGWQFQTCSNRFGVVEPNSFGLRMISTDFNPWCVGGMLTMIGMCEFAGGVDGYHRGFVLETTFDCKHRLDVSNGFRLVLG
jgi:hypothetical protein